MAPAVVVPEALRQRYLRTREGRAWLDGLPALVQESLQGFGMRPDAAAGTTAWHGYGALVLPVIAAGGDTPAVLKFPYPHPEAATETAALELWDGNGAVRLLERNASGTALLLERLDPGRTLMDVPMHDAVEVWGGLVRRLSLQGTDDPQWAAIPSVAERAEQFSDELPADWEALGRPFERWLLEAALEVCQTRGAVGRRSSRDVLVHADLHYGNILRRLDGSEEFAAIDPQAVFGEAEYAVAPMLWNRLDDLDEAAPRRSLEDRLSALCTAAGLDPQAAREWSILREVENALDYLRDGLQGDAQRSVWVAAALAGRSHPGLPSVQDLPAA
ncbi:aminoglycoside resistance protein [Arthrobacter sp. Sa2BUA2]|uniref:Aminoglycoside resistance protein n=1 Tax=Arthrobacter pullicola TaxID=2762224 RepID=A0ABR8YFE1_9MICC|nr:aminoglycoside phosphotransferase family protein [Arthrobacter pullicola]MBD8042935.1 aminoglycoside resistance protein [Arthrobacter pullicola]